MDAPCTTCNVLLHGQVVCISCEVSGSWILHIPHAMYEYMTRVYVLLLYTRGGGVYISCEVSDIWMLHVSHARYDNMGRVYVLAVGYQVCGCPVYNMQGMTTLPGCMNNYHIQGQGVYISCEVSGIKVESN